jgi:putative ABC transport system substrate-binding protein
MQRREFITLLGGAAAIWPATALAQQTGKVRNIGFLYPGSTAAAPPRITAVLTGLRAGGFRQPEDIEILPRITNGDAALLASMAADLVERKVDAIMAVSPAAVRAVRAATNTIPIVANDLESDPVGAGFVASVRRPGGNLTGVFLDFPDFSKKWLEQLREVVPQASAIAVFWDPATGTLQLKAVEAAAKTLNLKLETLELRGLSDVEPAFKAATQRGAGALLILSSPFIGANPKLFADLALAHRLPAITLFTEFAREGGLMAYGPDLLAFFRQGGVLVAKILAGEKPAELPIEAPTRFEFVLNLKTAAALGVSISPTTLLRADQVIE